MKWHRRISRRMAALMLLGCGTAFAGYVEDRAAAVKMMSQRQHAEALTFLSGRADGDLNDVQKSDALALAAECARSLKDDTRAEELATRIPLAPMGDMVRMQNLVAERKYEELVAQFGKEDIAAWPAYPARTAFVARGQAYAAIGRGADAEADFQQGLELMNEKRMIAELLWRIGQNRLQNLDDPAGALQVYQEVVARTEVRGYYIYYNCVLAAASLLRDQGRYDEALDTLDGMHPYEQSGSWRGAVLMAMGDTLAAAGRREEALAAYHDVAANEAAHGAHRDAAQAAIERLEEKGER